MAQNRSRFASRLPAVAVGLAVATLGFYLIFLRNGPTPTADASTTRPPVSAATPAIASEPPVATMIEPAVVEPVRTSAVAEPQRQDLALPDTAYEGRNAIGQAFAGEMDDARRASLAQKAIAWNQQLLVSNVDARDVDVAEIMQGENPTSFSRRFKQLHGEYGIVQLVNGIKNVNAIRAGTKLRVPKGTWSIVVDKSLFTLHLCYQGAPFKAYRVCIGADDKTPAAKWTVGTKTPKPTWTAPPDWLERERVKNPIKYGDPKNPLGEYWIALDCQTGSYQGFGIHGTSAPDSIGTKASMGCVRMLNEEVVEIARIAFKGMEVTTVE